jgi:rRNA maturation endonuclease Nob1
LRPLRALRENFCKFANFPEVIMHEIIPYANRLKQNLQRIESKMMELLEASTIDEFLYRGFIFAPNHYWGKTDERQKLLQMQLIKDYTSWFEHFKLLFSNASQEVNKQIIEINRFVTEWIEKKSRWDVPSTIKEAKSVFKEKVRLFYELISLLESAESYELLLVPDTNILITEPDISKYSKFVEQSKFTVILVPTVLSELDKLKTSHHNQDFKDKVISVIRRIKGLRNQGNLLIGVTVNKSVTVRMVAPEPNFDKTLHWLDSTNQDDRIIASTLELQRENPANIVVLITSDINLQNKAEMANLPYIETSNS